MKVIILAGGMGTRIQSRFPDRPKAMIPFGGKPFLEHQMRLLARGGFRSFVLCVGYKADQIVGYFGDGSALGLRIEYSIEAAQLGTGGALRHAEAFFREACLVLNGDTYLDMDYQSLLRFHAADPEAVGTLTVVARVDASRYGRILCDPDGRIRSFREKSADRLGIHLVSAGAYVLKPEILKHAPPGQSTLEKEVFPAALAAGASLYAFHTAAPFVDIGTPEGYESLKSFLG